MIVERFDVAALANPFPMFKICLLTAAKVNTLREKLMNEPLYMSDEHRTPEYIDHVIQEYFKLDSNHGFHLAYEILNFDGVLIFANIIDGFKCSLLMKLWNKDVWGPTGVRQARELIKYIMDMFKLRRVEAETPDKRVMKMARLVGMGYEGRKRNDFMWGGELYSQYMMAITRL